MGRDSIAEMHGALSYFSCDTRRKYAHEQTRVSAVTHRGNDSFTAGWTNMLKHTHTYADPVTHTPCTHMLNQCLMFCQGLKLYPPSAKNKCSEDIEERSPLKNSLNVEKREGELKCSSKG